MIRRIQNEQKPWVEHNFGTHRPAWQPLLGAVEELGELAHAFLKRDQGIRVNEYHKLSIEDALGDIVIYLMDFASAEDIDLQQVIERTWQEVKKRDWKKYPENGRTK